MHSISVISSAKSGAQGEQEQGGGFELRNDKTDDKKPDEKFWYKTL